MRDLELHLGTRANVEEVPIELLVLGERTSDRRAEHERAVELHEVDPVGRTFAEARLHDPGVLAGTSQTRDQRNKNQATHEQGALLHPSVIARQAAISSPSGDRETRVPQLTKPAKDARKRWNSRAVGIVYDTYVRLLIAIGLLVATTSVATADSDARSRAARAKLAAQIASLAEGKFDAFVTMFPDSNNSAAMFPSSRFVSVGRKAIRTAAPEWAGVGRTATAATIIGTPTVGQKLDGDTSKRAERLVVVSADLEAKIKGSSKPLLLRATSVFSDQIDPANPKALVPVALFISTPTETKDLRGEENLGESGEIDRFLDLLRVPDLLSERFDAGPGDVVIGTSAKEHVAGEDAKKLLESWHARKVTVVGKPHVVRQLDWVYVMATISLKRAGDKPAPINVLMVGYPICKGGCVGTEMTPHLVTLHYGQSR